MRVTIWMTPMIEGAEYTLSESRTLWREGEAAASLCSLSLSLAERLARRSHRPRLSSAQPALLKRFKDEFRNKNIQARETNSSV